MERNKQKQFFNIPLACDLMGESINQVLEQCAAFDAVLLTEEFFNDPSLGKERREYMRIFGPQFGVDLDIDDKLFFDTFDATVGFHCHFELQDYQAFSFVGINFVNNTAVECIISLGEPVNPERYRSEIEVTKVFLVSLEELYPNGRIQEESELGTRVYTWKKGDNVVSFVSYPPSHSPKDTGARLGVQIRDTQLHPQGGYFELLYNRAQKSVQDLSYMTLHRKDEPLEKVYEARSARYHLTSFLFLSAIMPGIGGIIALFLKNFTLGTILIILAALCTFLAAALHNKALRDYRQRRKGM